MASITPNELAQVAEKLESLLKNFNISLKVGLPNIIALHLPVDLTFKDETAMVEFGYQSLKAAGVHLHTQLEMVFIGAAQSPVSILLKGTPKIDIN
ncbi:hypothetical protein ASE74_04275 [Pedobacter sp. Leaf216]|uniref:hypothetical protein n=1 Tax=Pedobacter sp. Leaf216 TaxID=1735684 RepID=UPI0006FD7143|nr:hypothetical protein [Pedobacter sp. Leaf216]KQM69235.1 hypothetical protein ASE74_04275 [Pedobacter sp. Leaf216]